MTLLAGDLTTPQRVVNWLPNPPNVSAPILAQLITSMTSLIYGKLSRARTYSQTFTRTFDGVGNMQLVLPDYPVTSVSSVQNGAALVQQSVLPVPGTTQPAGTCEGYGWRLIPWAGDLPGQNAVLEFNHGYFYMGAQNIKVTYTAGYLISGEAWTVPAASPFTVTVLQPQGIWCRDNGVTYANGTALTPVASSPAVGQYVVGPDSTPGLYTFSSADAGAAVLISYSFIPSPLEEATIQMVAERLSYRTRIGELSKSLGGQETVRFLRGGTGRPYTSTSLPPEVMDLIHDYVNVVPPNIGAPV